MKSFKKLAGLILAVCLMVPMFGTIAFAAEGVLMFSDPSTKVGDNVSVDLVVQSSDGQAVGDVNVTMNYDTSSLEFVSGDGFSADGSGTLTYTGSGSSAELRATMQFRALLAGSTSISVSSSTATVSSGETLNLEQGASAVTIDPADDGSTSAEPTGTGAATGEAAGATTDIVVNVNGTDYNFSEAFTTADIPAGFSETTLNFNGADRKFVVNEGGIYLGYLVDASGAGSFFLYNSDNATFSPYVVLTISDTTSIIPLNEPDAVSLPENYQQVELTVQDQQYPAWSDPSTDRYYIIYATNTRTGEDELFQYDTEDNTYQHFEVPDQTENETAGASLPGAFGKFITSHILMVLIILIIIIILLLIFMIIFGVKLVHRNQELDDLYDEYDIPYDDEEEQKPEKKEKKSSKKQKDDDYEDDYEDDYDDYEDDYEDDYDDYDDDYEEDDYESEENRSKKGNSDEDGYDINFVDL